MSIVEDYIATLSPSTQTEFQRISAIVNRLVPDPEQGMSYAMPAFKYKGKAFLSFQARKEFLSLYPFSGKVIDKLHDALKDFECTSGSIHFSENHPLPDELIESIITCRLQEIDASAK